MKHYPIMQHQSHFGRKRGSVSYLQKLTVLKRMISEYTQENAALVDELVEIELQILVRKEERKFLLRKLCEFDPAVAREVQRAATGASTPATNSSPKPKKKPSESVERRSSTSKPRRPSVKSNKKRFVQPVEVDTVGEVVAERQEFHSEEAIFPVGYVSTRLYGSLKDPTIKCIYTCKISDETGIPSFAIACDDGTKEIIGDTPDVCHSLLLQKINDALSLNVVSTRPRGNEFFGLTHPTVLHLLQSYAAAKKCVNYKWTRFEVSKTAETSKDYNDAGLSYDYLQRSINLCKYKMAPDVLQKPSDYIDRV